MRARYDAPVALLPPGPPSRLTLEGLTTRSSPLTSHGRVLTSGPLHPVGSGRPIGRPGSNIRAKTTATSTPCRLDASVSPLRVPAAAPFVRGGTHRRRVLGVCNRLNTSRLVRGRLRKIIRYATPRRPPATVVDVRRAIRVRRVRFPPPGAGGGAVREGGHAPETRAGRLQPPQHFQTCERPPTQDYTVCYPPKAAGHRRRRAKSNPRRGKCLDTSPSQKIMKTYHQSYSPCAHVV